MFTCFCIRGKVFRHMPHHSVVSVLLCPPDKGPIYLMVRQQTVEISHYGKSGIY